MVRVWFSCRYRHAFVHRSALWEHLIPSGHASSAIVQAHAGDEGKSSLHHLFYDRFHFVVGVVGVVGHVFVSVVCSCIERVDALHKY